MSTADDASHFCSTFEGELLIELMLRHWHHPHADDAEFRNDLIESSAGVLNDAIEGSHILEEVPPHQMNLVAAAWYAELTSLQASADEIEESELELRQQRLDTVRRSVPSCFCDHSDLPD